MSNFFALITGGSSAPSEGGEKITMVSFSTAWACAALEPSAERDGASAQAPAASESDFISSSPIVLLVDAEQLLQPSRR